MHATANIVILAASLLLANTGRPPDAVPLFHCQFDQRWDANYDGWPDGWTRKRGEGFPRYVKIEIQPEQSASSGRCVKMELDGGAASIYSPPIPVDPRFSYALQAKLKTRGLQYDQAYVTVTYYNADEQQLETLTSRKLTDAPEWEVIHIGPMSPAQQEITSAIVGLHLHPGEKHDLNGSAWFDDIWFARLPRMTVHTSRALNFYTDAKEVQIACEIWGAREQSLEVHFELLDESGRRIGEQTMRLAGEPIAAETLEPGSDAADSRPSASKGYSAKTRWQPPIEHAGYYVVQATMRSADGVEHQRQVSLVVIDPVERRPWGEFGWTLPEGESPLAMDQLVELLPHTGIHWAKFPLWHLAEKGEQGDALLKFAQRLGSRHVQLVGLLDQPPAEVLAKLDGGSHAPIASILSADPSHWLPSLDPIMTRLSLKVRWWQLGGDHDTSFVSYPELPQRIRELRGQLFRLGQKAYLGIAWEWLSDLPSEESPPWDFITFTADPPLSGTDLAAYLGALNQLPAQRWVLVEPLPASQYDLAARAQDLVVQMVSAKIHGAHAIFLPDPFSSEHGLMHDDGTPNPLLLVWRTTALHLAGATYLGSMPMPMGSHTHIFSRDGETTMVIWNQQQAQEIIYLGRDVRQTEVWGRTSRPAADGERQVIDVGPVPMFLTGVDERIARWSMAVTLEKSKLPSVFGQPHQNSITLQNSFSRGVDGQLRIVAPRTWHMIPDRINVRLLAQERQSLPFEVVLPLGVSNGQHQIRIDFDISADEPYQFSVYRQLEVGLGDVEIDLATRLDEDGSLVVEQQTTNREDQEISFKFVLYAPNRRSKRSHVFGLGRGQDVKIYRYPNGKELLGKTLWLRAEEFNGPRIFNHRIVAEE